MINVMLLIREIMEYLINNNIDILMSLDGLEEIYDLNRKFVNGIGFFVKILSNL